jgi:quinolinate synthase
MRSLFRFRPKRNAAMEIQELQEEIRRKKEEKDVVILAHYYQQPEIQDIADIVGDSLELSRMAASAPQGTILFCGVRFMAETAKILCPDKKVLTPYPQAGCLLADMADPRQVEEAKKAHPTAQVVAYVNVYAEIKALADIVCTSANARKVMEKVEGEKILFVPDRNLGAYHARRMKGKDVLLWSGYCPIHEKITLASIDRVKKQHPDALVIVHPECPPEVTKEADFVGSTSQLLRFVEDSDAKCFIVGTEEGIVHQMRKKAPGKDFLLPDPTPICDQMKMITLERVYTSLKEDIYPVTVEETIRAKAEKAIRRMLEL